ncbi:PRC-barrel domain-containing protein [soil metagenome]
MQRNINSLIGYSMGATDGEIGKVAEFYFEDENWNIRYMIVKTGGWLFGRSVLISPGALQIPNWKKSEFPVNLSKEQIKNSPDIDTDKPVSRQMDRRLYEYYSGQNNQPDGGFIAGGIGGIPGILPGIDHPILSEVNNPDKQFDDDLHLRSTKQVARYHIYGIDGEIGKVIDFIMDDTTWQLKYLIIEPLINIGGNLVLIHVENIKEIIWEKSKVVTNMSIEAVKDCTPFFESTYNHT